MSIGIALLVALLIIGAVLWRIAHVANRRREKDRQNRLRLMYYGEYCWTDRSISFEAWLMVAGRYIWLEVL